MNLKHISKEAKKLSKFKDKYKNERCFIIGNGPSLRMEDLEKLHANGEYTFGSNRVYVAFDKTKWRPTFYVIQDGEMIREYHNEIEGVNIKNKFISDYAILKWNCPRIRSGYLFHLQCDQFYPFCPDFTDDITKGIPEGFTVTYACIQIAAYMGFDKIYLLGVDHNYSTVKDASGKIVELQQIRNYFIDSYSDNRQLNAPQTHKSGVAYTKAEVYSKLHGFRIYNATRGGMLEAFERVDFDEITQKSANSKK